MLGGVTLGNNGRKYDFIELFVEAVEFAVADGVALQVIHCPFLGKILGVRVN